MSESGHLLTLCVPFEATFHQTNQEEDTDKRCDFSVMRRAGQADASHVRQQQHTGHGWRESGQEMKAHTIDCLG